jgi:rRNA small subunit pseudouridine methyltransferase Nep1
MLTLILADSELELVPPELCGHPAITTTARKRGRSPSAILLDSTLHYPALKNFPDGFRRGRPDLVHFFLLTALDSILNLEGGLRVLVHTRNGQVIRFSPDIRLPKNLNRFVALTEQLFAEGRVPVKGDPLMTLGRATVKALVDESKADTVIAFSPEGKPTELRSYFEGQKAGNITCIIGGFPDGDFTSPVYELADEKLSISAHLLKVWTVASEVLVNYPRPPKKAACQGAMKPARTASRAPRGNARISKSAHEGTSSEEE